MKYVGIPGLDSAHVKAGDQPPISDSGYRASPKIASSAAHFYGKERVLIEAFHSQGWDMNIQDMKWNIDIMSVLGVNFYVPHGYFYSTDGLRKHDAPPSAFFQMPEWKYTKQLSDYMVHLLENLQGHRVVDILVLDPITSVWAATDGKGSQKTILQHFADMQSKLLRNGYDFYVVDPLLLVKSQIIEKKLR